MSDTFFTRANASNAGASAARSDKSSGSDKSSRRAPPIIDQDGNEVRMGGPFDGGAFAGGSFRGGSFGGGPFDSAGGAGFGNHPFGSMPFGPLTREQRFARLDALARLLDVAFIVPGTKVRYGIDGLIGLVPIIGDLLTTAISLWIVREARALGAPKYLVARMLGNVAIDGVFGIVPFVGDAFDVMFRANMRNMRLLKRWMDKQPRMD